jgi:hypothetical protein
MILIPEHETSVNSINKIGVIRWHCCEINKKSSS